MIIKSTYLDGIYEIENNKFEDSRGLFVKTFHAEEFDKNGLESGFRESFYSISKKNVLRGMHYQLPPDDHAKLVYVIHGEIIDVAVDIRKDSPTFGNYFSTHLSGENAKSLYIAKGFAHGFLTLSDSATLVYMTTTTHVPSSDTGIKWDSFGYDWEGNIYNLTISERDKKHICLDELNVSV